MGHGGRLALWGCRLPSPISSYPFSAISQLRPNLDDDCSIQGQNIQWAGGGGTGKQTPSPSPFRDGVPLGGPESKSPGKTIRDLFKVVQIPLTQTALNSLFSNVCYEVVGE